MTTFQGVEIANFLTLLDTDSELIKLHALKAALSLEPNNLFLIRSLLWLAVVKNGLSPGDRVELVLDYVNYLDDNAIARMISWEVGRVALRHQMYKEAVVLFEICSTRTLQDSKEELLLANFFQCHSIYHIFEHTYSEFDLQVLERSRQLSEEMSPEFRLKKSVPRVSGKQELQQLLCLFTAKAQISLSKWDDLRKNIEGAPSEEVIPLIRDSTANIPNDIHLLCLQKLLHSVTDFNIYSFANLFHSMVTRAYLVDPASAIKYFRQVYDA